MEDGNMLAADCIVISCCCQCMILQILVFILLKVPRKMFKKTKELYAKKFRARKKAARIEMGRYGEDSFGSLGDSFKIDVKDFCVVESLRFGCCMDEIEGIFNDFSSRGEFAFGSFWGGGMSSSRSFRSCLKEEHELDYDDVGCRLMELFGATNFSCH
ncbi:hypothetical protein ACS0TY_009642 [Phlomoides rotata]